METSTPLQPADSQPAPPGKRSRRRTASFEGVKLLTPPEVDRAYRLRNGTALAAAKAGEVKCCTRKPRRGRIGYLIDATDAARLWGAR